MFMRIARGAASRSEKISSNELALCSVPRRELTCRLVVVKRTRMVTGERWKRGRRSGRGGKRRDMKKRRRRRREEEGHRWGKRTREEWETRGAGPCRGRSQYIRSVVRALRNRGFTKAAEIGDKRDNSWTVTKRYLVSQVKENWVKRFFRSNEIVSAKKFRCRADKFPSVARGRRRCNDCKSIVLDRRPLGFARRTLTRAPVTVLHHAPQRC